MALYVNKIEAIGVYGRFDIRQEFQDGINIVFGKNGTGKTTLLHILANALSGDFERFRYLQFNTIKIWLSDGKLLLITSKQKDGSIRSVGIGPHQFVTGNNEGP
jgi:predicted ATP-binding protein involved in virulence